MGSDGWYRRRSWSDEEERAFYERLKRSRGAFHKAQYLRIQAFHLAEANLHAAAIRLLDDLIANHPDASQLAAGLRQRGESKLRAGSVAEGMDDLRRAFEAERKFPSVRSFPCLTFAYEAAMRGLADLYDEAEAMLKEEAGDGGFPFPVQRFLYAASRAVIAGHRGDATKASELARRALRDAGAGHSGFSRHAQVGLVRDVEQNVREKLVELAQRT